MSDHGWGGGDWPDDLDPDSGGGDLGPDTPDLGSDLGPDLGGDLGPDFGEADTADLGDYDHHLDPLSGDPTADDALSGDPSAGGHEPALDPAGDSTVDFPHALDGPDSGLDSGPDADTGDGDPGTDGDPGPTPVGADPDLDAHADTWTDQSFPEPLDLDAPEPVDGFPWTDPTTLGTEPLPDPDASYQGAPEATELASYAGQDLPPGADPWTALSASEDPATSSLARWWSPGT